MLKCAHCDKKYKYESERKRHQESHFPQFGCPVCAKNFSFLSALRRHQKQHERKGSVRCTECGGNFRDDTLLKRHIQYAHKGSFSCLKCSSVFSSEQALRTHSNIHKPESERRFWCTFEGCKKRFNFPHHLKHHELTHTNAKQHFCNLCGKGFIQAHHLKTHVKSHHSENWLYCTAPNCKKKFITKLAWKKHVTVHNKYVDVACSEIKLESGNSSDSNAAIDTREKSDTGGNIQCVTCGKFIPRLQYLHHTLKCNAAPTELNKCSDLRDALLNHDSKFELAGSINSTYQVASSTYAGEAKVPNNMGSINSTYQIASSTYAREAKVPNNIQSNSANTESRSIVGAVCNDIARTPCSGCGCAELSKAEKLKQSKSNMPELEYREDGIIKIKESFDSDIIVVNKVVDLEKQERNEPNDVKYVPFNSCKAVLGNCIVSEDGSVGEGCLCAKMLVDEQVSAQEIDELTLNSDALWI